MIYRIIEFSLKNRFIVVALYLLLAGCHFSTGRVKLVPSSDADAQLSPKPALVPVIHDTFLDIRGPVE